MLTERPTSSTIILTQPGAEYIDPADTLGPTRNDRHLILSRIDLAPYISSRGIISPPGSLRISIGYLRRKRGRGRRGKCNLTETIGRMELYRKGLSAGGIGVLWAARRAYGDVRQQSTPNPRCKRSYDSMGANRISPIHLKHDTRPDPRLLCTKRTGLRSQRIMSPRDRVTIGSPPVPNDPHNSQGSTNNQKNRIQPHVLSARNL